MSTPSARRAFGVAQIRLSRTEWPSCFPYFSMALWRGRAAGMFQDPRPQLRSVERHMSPVMTFQEPLHRYSPDHHWAFRDSYIQPNSPPAVVHICDSRVLFHRDRA